MLFPIGALKSAQIQLTDFPPVRRSLSNKIAEILMSAQDVLILLYGVVWCSVSVIYKRLIHTLWWWCVSVLILLPAKLNFLFRWWFYLFIDCMNLWLHHSSTSCPLRCFSCWLGIHRSWTSRLADGPVSPSVHSQMSPSRWENVFTPGVKEGKVILVVRTNELHVN